jgi:hypothetical protein
MLSAENCHIGVPQVTIVYGSAHTVADQPRGALGSLVVVPF